MILGLINQKKGEENVLSYFAFEPFRKKVAAYVIRKLFEDLKDEQKSIVGIKRGRKDTLDKNGDVLDEAISPEYESINAKLY